MEVDVRRIVPLVCVGLFLLTAAEPAFAQQRLFVRMVSEVVELDSRQPSVGAVLRRFRVPWTTHVVTFDGGQSLAWATAGGIVLLDTLSGAVRQFTFPGFSPSEVIGTDGNARLVVLGSSGSEAQALVADARTGQVHFVDLGPSSMLRRVAYASASDVLFATRRTPINQAWHDVDVIHAGTGTLVKTLDVSPAFPDNRGSLGTRMWVNTAGTRLFVSRLVAGTFAFDVVSGTLAGSNDSWSFDELVLDELRNRSVAGITPYVSAFSADSLTLLGTVTVPSPPLPPNVGTSGFVPRIRVGVSGLSATIFVLDSLFMQPPTCRSQLHALDADTGHVRRTVDMTGALGDGMCDTFELIRVTEPPPPPAPTANVSGRQVTLTWRAPFGATRYEVEAGSAPGLANITTIKVSDPQLVIDGVPSGTYHVRVRGINTIGKSDASHDVRVVVP